MKTQRIRVMSEHTGRIEIFSFISSGRSSQPYQRTDTKYIEQDGFDLEIPPDPPGSSGPRTFCLFAPGARKLDIQVGSGTIGSEPFESDDGIPIIIIRFDPEPIQEPWESVRDTVRKVRHINVTHPFFHLMWKSLHYLSLRYTDVPVWREQIRSVLDFVPNFIGCRVCSIHYRKYLEEHPVEEAMGSQEDFFKYMVDLHNDVNQRMNKPTIDYETARTIYQDPQVRIDLYRYGGDILAELSNHTLLNYFHRINQKGRDMMREERGLFFRYYDVLPKS